MFLKQNLNFLDIFPSGLSLAVQGLDARLHLRKAVLNRLNTFGGLAHYARPSAGGSARSSSTLTPKCRERARRLSIDGFQLPDSHPATAPGVMPSASATWACVCPLFSLICLICTEHLHSQAIVSLYSNAMELSIPPA